MLRNYGAAIPSSGGIRLIHQLLVAKSAHTSAVTVGAELSASSECILHNLLTTLLIHPVQNKLGAFLDTEKKVLKFTLIPDSSSCIRNPSQKDDLMASLGELTKEENQLCSNISLRVTRK